MVRQTTFSGRGSGSAEVVNPPMTEFIPFADLVALAIFALLWGGYALLIEQSASGRQALNARMNIYRDIWIKHLLARDMRMVDMQIMGALQNGAAFFASSTILAIGGAFALLRSSDEVLSAFATLPLWVPPSRALWEIKNIGLVVILIYTFFKFAWSYRLFNYVAILIGAMPFSTEKDTDEADRHVTRTVQMFVAAGTHFNRGQRGFFAALGYLGWFIGPWVLIATTVFVVAVMWVRQFKSEAARAI